MSHNDFAVYNSGVGDMVCETCLPNLISAPKKNVPKQIASKKISKICAACSGKWHWRGNLLLCPKSKKTF